MDHNFIPYEQAFQLKQLGFDEPCLAVHFYDYVEMRDDEEFDEEDDIVTMFHQDLNDNEFYINSKLDECIPEKSAAAPTWLDVFDWFRIKHGIDSYCRQTNLKGHAHWKIEKLETEDKIKGYSKFADTISQARIDCLDQLIKIISK